MAGESPHPYKLQQTMDFIRRAIAGNRYPSGSALPPIRRLAALAGVSYVTMWKAVSILRRQGVLTVVRGRLVKSAGDLADASGDAGQLVKFAGDLANVSSDVPAEPEALLYAPGLGWHRLRDQIQRDILNGAYAQDSRLPLLKELMKRYDTSYPTLAKALRDLQRTGILSATGRGFSVQRISIPGPRTTVCVLIDREYLDRFFAGNPAGHNYLPILELEASRRGFGVNVQACSYEAGQHLPQQPGEVFPETDDFLGYIYIVNSPSGSEQLLHMLGKRGKPVSILEEYWKWPYAVLLGNSPIFKIFPVGSRATPGSAVGRYLLGLGHRRVAYLSINHHARWSIERLAGLRNAFAGAGYPEAVRPFTIDVDILLQEMAKIDAGQHPRTARPQPTAKASRARPTGEEARRARILEAVYPSSERTRRQLRARFCQALADEDITAWVAANDCVAILASDFLRRAGVAVPGHLSLVSFDNDVNALAYRISSYDFNIPAIVNAAISHIVEFVPRHEANGPLCVEIDGLVVDRRSAGRPRAIPRSSGD
jgi:DNA-binding transcriptional regulator YhcF (GntR family)